MTSQIPSNDLLNIHIIAMHTGTSSYKLFMNSAEESSPKRYLNYKTICVLLKDGGQSYPLESCQNFPC